MKKVVIICAMAGLAGCASPAMSEEQIKLAYRSDACSNPELERKPVWCPAPKSRLQLPVDHIDNPQGRIVNGRWER